MSFPYKFNRLSYDQPNLEGFLGRGEVFDILP